MARASNSALASRQLASAVELVHFLKLHLADSELQGMSAAGLQVADAATVEQVVELWLQLAPLSLFPVLPASATPAPSAWLDRKGPSHQQALRRRMCACLGEASA